MKIEAKCIGKECGEEITLYDVQSTMGSELVRCDHCELLQIIYWYSAPVVKVFKPDIEDVDDREQEGV